MTARIEVARLRLPLDARTVTGLAPDGWVVKEPYTFCTYCPTCWGEITREDTP